MFVLFLGNVIIEFMSFWLVSSRTHKHMLTRWFDEGGKASSGSSLFCYVQFSIISLCLEDMDYVNRINFFKLLSY